MAAEKNYRAELVQWPNESYALLVTAIEDEPQAIDPIAVWEVRSTSTARVSAYVIASLVGHETTHRVWRTR